MSTALNVYIRGRLLDRWLIVHFGAVIERTCPPLNHISFAYLPAICVMKPWPAFPRITILQRFVSRTLMVNLTTFKSQSANDAYFNVKT